MSLDELGFCKEYVTIMFKLLRSETQECAWMNLRVLQELEEFADKAFNAGYSSGWGECYDNDRAVVIVGRLKQWLNYKMMEQL